MMIEASSCFEIQQAAAAVVEAGMAHRIESRSGSIYMYSIPIYNICIALYIYNIRILYIYM